MKKLWFTLLLTLLIALMVGCSTGSTESSSADNQTDSTENSDQVDTAFPEKDIEVIVPFSPGGTTDIIARAIVEGAKEYLPNNKSIIVTNKEGGAATIGTSEVANADPDGYKLLITTTSPITIKTHESTTTFDKDDLKPLMRLADVPQVLLVQTSSGWENIDDWLTYVKENPGKFKYGVSGIGTTGHLVMEQLNKVENLNTEVVPYEGSSAAVAALLGGNIDGAIMATADVDQSKITGLFTFGDNSVAFPDAPTLKENGIDVDMNLTIGLFAPVGISDEVSQIIEEAFAKALEDEKVIENITRSGSIISYADSQEFTEALNEEYEIFGDLLNDLGINE